MTIRSQVMGLQVARRRSEGRSKRQMVGRNECGEMKVEGKVWKMGGTKGLNSFWEDSLSE